MKNPVVLGTRPQIVKSTPFIHLADIDGQIELSIIHTGQHYDYEMTKTFFKELRLPFPTVNLGVGSGSHAQQTADMMLRLEKILQRNEPDIVLLPGDTNSTLAGALTAAKLSIPIAHLEAGARSHDKGMPEEINRCLTDHCSSMLFTPTENCTKNLLKEGIEKDRIHEVGDTLYDLLLVQLAEAKKNPILKQLMLQPRMYALLTVHRPENVDEPCTLENIVRAVTELKRLVFVFPIHPRTRSRLQKLNFYNKLRRQDHIRLVEPLGYRQTIRLVENARLVLTDSGGLQKEAFWLKTPCITLRKNTEWTETVQLGANRLVYPRATRILKTITDILQQKDIERRMQNLPSLFGDGRASERIVNLIKNY